MKHNSRIRSAMSQNKKQRKNSNEKPKTQKELIKKEQDTYKRI